MVSTGPLLCALLAAVRLAISTVGGCIGAETRVRGIDLALSTVIRGIEAASPGTHPGIGYSYDETASDRANQYNGRVFDPGTGFHDYGARMYWPQIGRFISADSYQGDIANPASLNRYSYVLNNPYKYVDPTGRNPAAPAIWFARIGGAIVSGAEVVAAVGAAVTTAAVAIVVVPESLHEEPYTAVPSKADATLLPDAAWDRKAPKFGPSGETIDWQRYNPKTGELEDSKVDYDEFGRQRARTDYTDHGRPKEHDDPHHHETEYGPGKESGQESGPKPGPAPGHPDTPQPPQEQPQG